MASSYESSDETTIDAPSDLPEIVISNPQLVRLIEAWENLPTSVIAVIVAMIEAVAPPAQGQ